MSPPYSQKSGRIVAPLIDDVDIGFYQYSELTVQV